MPVATIDLTGDGALGLVSGTTILDEGHIESVTAFVKDGTTPSGNTRINVSVAGPAGTPASKTATLVDGYVYNGGDAAWDGHVFTQLSETILVQMRSADTATIRVAIKTLKLDP